MLRSRQVRGQDLLCLAPRSSSTVQVMPFLRRLICTHCLVSGDDVPSLRRHSAHLGETTPPSLGRLSAQFEVTTKRRFCV
jgi:hypothetical protein